MKQKMSALPFNNLDEQLAKFAAAKKNVTLSNTPLKKQFTFKKALSRGQSNSTSAQHQFAQPYAERTISDPGSNITSRFTQKTGKTLNKQETITNFFSQTSSNNKLLNQKNKTDPNQSLSFNDDIFADDMDDFIIPSTPRPSGTDKKDKSPSFEKSVATTSKSISNDKPSSYSSTSDSSKGTDKNDMSPSFGKSVATISKSVSNDKPSSYSSTSGYSKVFESSFDSPGDDASNIRNKKFTFKSLSKGKTKLDNDKFTNSSISASSSNHISDRVSPLPFYDEDDEILSRSVRKKRVQQIFSDDEDSDPCDVSEKSEPPDIKNAIEKDSCFVKGIRSSDSGQSKKENIENISLPECRNVEDIKSSDMPDFLSSLHEINTDIMTKICDSIIEHEHVVRQIPHLKQLLDRRKNVLKQIQTAKIKCQELYDNSYIYSSPSLISNPRSSNNRMSNSPAFSSSITNNSTPVGNDSSHNKLRPLPLFGSKDKLNISDGAGPSNNTSGPCFYKASEYLNGSVDSASLNKSDSFVINIDNIETQNLLEKTVYDISDDEQPQPGPSTSKNNVNNESIIAGKFYGNQRDDGATQQFKGFKFPFSNDIQCTFQNVFGLKTFRHNQLEAINAALLKEDCFVLMPTGGGKSLCYQLPALITSGVTIVISPLRSLIMDQVQKLNSLDIPAFSLTGDTDTGIVNQVYRQLSAREPGVKLLYVTPEKISASVKLIAALENLYSRSMIQRFVIDEAHCVSQWGHDFRPDYKKLRVLREKFSKVPIMALTATATPRVRMDILNQLGMKSPKWFLQSFNRPNLKYQVRPKTKSVVDEIIELIHGKFSGLSGIVYCLSRNDCDKVAEKLCANDISASSYHAGLNNRESVQESWINDKFKVICATIAFGMGIDKPDVRFVIHHSVPKSIEGYYQESGRAGRDGDRSWCILFFGFRDIQRLKGMVKKDEANKQMWGTHFENIERMGVYCENKTDCRRVWMLEYFGEKFDKELCLKQPSTSCDNCHSKDAFEMCDVTEDAKAIVQCVANIVNHTQKKNYTLLYFVDIYKGSKTKKIMDAKHDKLELHGKGQRLSRSDAERLLRKLVFDHILQEETFINKLNQMDLPVTYVYLGKKSKELLNGQIKVSMAFTKGSKKKSQVAETSQKEDKEMEQLIEKCYNALIDVSKAIALERNMKYINVINFEALKKMSRVMPASEEDMLAIPHVTRALYEKYGNRFLEVTQQYCAERCVLEAERQDKAAMDAMLEDRGNWSDAEPPSQNVFAKGRKRKSGFMGGQSKKPKTGFFRKKYNFKGKKKTSAPQSKAKNKTASADIANRVAIVRAPGFLPMPKTGKPVRSFLSHPKMTML